MPSEDSSAQSVVVNTRERRDRRHWAGRHRTILAVLVLAVALLVVSHARASAAALSSSTAVASQCGDVEVSPMSQFGSEVITLGETTYPDAFAGAFVSDCDTLLTIGVVSSAPDSSAFLAAVAARSSAETTYTVADESNSWAVLSELTQKLSDVTWAQWESYGQGLFIVSASSP
jgi:hypothetical protein